MIHQQLFNEVIIYTLHIQPFHITQILINHKLKTWLIFQTVWFHALSISYTEPQQASLVFLPQVMYHMRLFEYKKRMEIQQNPNAQEDHEQLKHKVL